MGGYAMYCLVLFYLALKKQPIGTEGYTLFAAMRPIPKFICIKGVVFFTYWQSVIIAGLVYLNVIKSTTYWTSTNIAVGLQDTLICFEMFVAAIAHIYAFKANDFSAGSGQNPLIPAHKVIFDVANFTDIASDASKHMFHGNNHAHELMESPLLLQKDNMKNENQDLMTDFVVKNQNEVNSKQTALECKLN